MGVRRRAGFNEGRILLNHEGSTNLSPIIYVDNHGDLKMHTVALGATVYVCNLGSLGG